jgi:hypothetical protein
MNENSQIVDAIDSDDDDFVTEQEMRDWIKSVNRKYIMKDVGSRWETFDKENDLDKYIEHNYGSLNLCKNDDDSFILLVKYIGLFLQPKNLA